MVQANFFSPITKESCRGVERGIGQGIEKKAKETAIRMLNKGFDIVMVSEMTGLDREELRKLAATAATTH